MGLENSEDRKFSGFYRRPLGCKRSWVQIPPARLFQRKPFGDNVEGLSYFKDESYAIET